LDVELTVVFPLHLAVTFAATDTGGLNAAEVCGTSLGLVLPSCRNGADGWAVGVPFGMAGVCPFSSTTATGLTLAAPTARTATAAIDLSGTGLQLTAGSTTHLSQFVHLGDLAMVMQPNDDDDDFTTSSRSNRYGVDATTTTSGSTRTGTVEYGVRPGMGVADRGLYIQRALDSINQAGAPIARDDCGALISQLEALFCDFVINDDWVSDLSGGASILVNQLEDEGTQYCSGEQSWGSERSPTNQTVYEARLREITSGGYGICTCIEGDAACGTATACGWTTPEAGYQRHHYDESTATNCTDTEYEAAAFTPTTDRVCTANCPAGSRVADGSRQSDRTCSACIDEGGYSVGTNQQSCTLLTACNTPNSNRCGNSPAGFCDCDPDNTGVSGCTASYAFTAPTATSDRVCSRCPPGVSFYEDANTGCSQLTPECGFNETVRPTPTRNRVCDTRNAAPTTSASSDGRLIMVVVAVVLIATIASTLRNRVFISV